MGAAVARDAREGLRCSFASPSSPPKVPFQRSK